MKTATILSVIGLIMFSIVALAQTSTSTYFCNNNGICDTDIGETTTNCEKDCSQATTLRGTCGDKICQSTESKSSCSVDCGYPWVCGDGICGGTETDWNCPQDCPKPEVPSVYCGDKICQSTEGQNSCPVDCGYPLICGDGICSGTDTYDNCPKDCSQPTTTSATTTFGGNTGGGGGVISTTPTAVAILPYTKCGLNNYRVCNECGLGVYKNVYVQCSDGSEITLGVASSCKPADLWNQYATEACTNHCSSGGWGGWSDLVSGPIVCAEGISGDVNRSTPILPATIRPVEIPRATSICYISDNLMQQYSQLITELQKSESNQARAEEITQQIIALKQQIATQQKECVSTSPQSTPTTVSRIVSTGSPIATENIPVAVSIDRCNEVAQWETKIAYYKNLSSLSDADLKKEGFSREEIEKILQELASGIEKVRAQCGGQEKTPVVSRVTAITGSASIMETVKPVVIESGQEISVYYKARLEKAVSAKGEEKQIEELKALRDEIDGLISNLIKSRKELEVSELNNLVKEVKVSRGEIKADDIVVKTTEKKMLFNIGDRPVSIEPTVNQVVIRDKGLEVNTNEVMIKENVLSVGGVDVRMSASEVAEKLNIAPKTIELKEENAKAVYDMKIEERRKLFGFIPFDRQRIVTADAENGNTLSEGLPWYNFMTTK
ncbi:MAG: DUF6483 family protein [Candidatus Nealsonbacteria bacterium]|nr:DUF6483 family protein [Candidatus Nealsonbacteria bacterium]